MMMVLLHSLYLALKNKQRAKLTYTRIQNKFLLGFRLIFTMEQHRINRYVINEMKTQTFKQRIAITIQNIANDKFI